MGEFLNNEYYTSIIVFISQLIFIYLRTINVIYTAEKRMVPALVTGVGVALFWLISSSIGINSLMKGQIIPIIGFILGGSLGTYFGIKKETKK